MSLFLSIPNTRWSKYYFHSIVIEEIYSTAAHTFCFLLIILSGEHVGLQKKPREQ